MRRVKPRSAVEDTAQASDRLGDAFGTTAATQHGGHNQEQVTAWNPLGHHTALMATKSSPVFV